MWSRINLLAILIAFMVELGVDRIIQQVLLLFFTQGMLAPDMTEEQLRPILEAVTAQANYLLWALLLGTATTVAGGYFAARLAKSFPYYNGLGIGIVGILFMALMSVDGPAWYAVVGYVTCIPASIYGAHFAKKRMDQLV